MLVLFNKFDFRGSISLTWLWMQPSALSQLNRWQMWFLFNRHSSVSTAKQPHQKREFRNKTPFCEQPRLPNNFWLMGVGRISCCQSLCLSIHVHHKLTWETSSIPLVSGDLPPTFWDLIALQTERLVDTDPSQYIFPAAFHLHLQVKALLGCCLPQNR